MRQRRARSCPTKSSIASDRVGVLIADIHIAIGGHCNGVTVKHGGIGWALLGKIIHVRAHIVGVRRAKMQNARVLHKGVHRKNALIWKNGHATKIMRRGASGTIWNWSSAWTFDLSQTIYGGDLLRLPVNAMHGDEPRNFSGRGFMVMRGFAWYAGLVSVGVFVFLFIFLRCVAISRASRRLFGA